MIDGTYEVKKQTTEQEKEEERREMSCRLKIVGVAILTAVALDAVIIGYNQLSKNTKFTYVSDEDDNFKAEGKVKYNEVKNWWLVEKELIDGKHKLFICDVNGVGFFDQSYKDIFNYNTICEGYVKKSGKLADDTLIEKKKLEDYLLAYDMVKAYYTIDDMDKLLDMIEEDYEYTTDKTLEKVY